MIPPDCSLAVKPLQKSDPPSDVKKAYRKAVRLVHPDKIAGLMRHIDSIFLQLLKMSINLFAGTGNVIEVEKKMLAAEVFITINEYYEKFRMQHDDM